MPATGYQIITATALRTGRISCFNRYPYTGSLYICSIRPKGNLREILFT